MTHKRLAGMAIAFFLCAALSGCGRVQQTLPPIHADKLGTRVQLVTDRFRICGIEFDRSVVADPVTPPNEGEIVSGYSNHIRGGQSCDTQESFAYAGLVHFDQAQLQGKIILSANLLVDRRNTNLPVRVDRVVPTGIVHDAACHLVVRMATEDWPAGRSSGTVAAEALPGTRDREGTLEQQNSIIGAGLGVREVVQQWALGRKANHGFVIMAQPGSLAKNENTCTGYWSNPRLQLTVLDFPSP